MTEKVSGLATEQNHYKKAAMQPIEVMQTLMNHEQFLGFLMGNVIKYRMRAKYKGTTEQDRGKAKQYMYWYRIAANGHEVSPENDIPPENWDGDVFY